jgi:hypothetical protein
VVKRKIRSPRQESNPRTPIVQPIAGESEDKENLVMDRETAGYFQQGYIPTVALNLAPFTIVACSSVTIYNYLPAIV